MNIDWLLSESVTVKRPTTVPTQYGGTTVTYDVVGTFMARVSPRLPRLSFTVPVTDDEQTQRAMRVCYFQPDADVRRNDIIESGSDVFRVISTVTPSVDAYKRVDAVWTEPGA